MGSNRQRKTVSLKPRHTVWLSWNDQLGSSRLLQDTIDDRIEETVDTTQFQRELEFLGERGQSADDVAEQFDNYEEFSENLNEVITSND